MLEPLVPSRGGPTWPLHYCFSLVTAERIREKRNRAAEGIPSATFSPNGVLVGILYGLGTVSF